MRVLDLFSGIGGFSLGLERAGFKTVAFCEVESYCQQVLAKHWPTIPCYDDVRTLTAERLRADGIAVDVICGGFPCQDISFAGKGAGINGARSGLWVEYARLIGELRPRYVIVENVAALLNRGLERVLGDLAALGFDAEWHCVPAAAVGAPHRRDRLWLVAYPGRDRRDIDGNNQEGAEGTTRGSIITPGERRTHSPRAGDVADASCERFPEERQLRQRQAERPASGREVLAHTQGMRWQTWSTQNLPDEQGGARVNHGGWWAIEPDVGRVAHGIPARVDRLTALGNAVVPQITEIIGRAIMSYEQKNTPAEAGVR